MKHELLQLDFSLCDVGTGLGDGYCVVAKTRNDEFTILVVRFIMFHLALLQQMVQSIRFSKPSR